MEVEAGQDLPIALRELGQDFEHEFYALMESGGLFGIPPAVGDANADIEVDLVAP